MNYIFNILILIISTLGYSIYNYTSNIKDLWIFIMMSLIFSLGIFSLIKSFQYLIICKKVKAKIIKINYSKGSSGLVQDIGSYSRGYNYNYLINNEIYSMIKNLNFGSKYKINNIVQVAIINEKQKKVIPIRLVYNTIFIGIICLYISIQMIPNL